MSALENEVEQAFQACRTTGSVDEDWARWPEHLTGDVHYVERLFGTMHGREAVRSWITELMVVRADVHAVLDWYVVKGRRVILSMQNRYYAADPAQPHSDFAGLTVLEYAGDGQFGYEEDYWNLAGAKTAYERFTAEVERYGGRGLESGAWNSCRPSGAPPPSRSSPAVADQAILASAHPAPARRARADATARITPGRRAASSGPGPRRRRAGAS